MQDGKTLYCVRRLLWDQVDQMIDELNEKDDNSSSIRYFNATGNDAQHKGNRFRQKGGRYNQGRQNTDSFKQNGSARPEKLCGACLRAGKPESVYSSHNMTSCSFLSNGEKSKLLKAAARLLKTEDNTQTTDLTGEEQPDSDSSESS